MTVHFNFRPSEIVKTRLRQLAEERGVTMTQVLNDLVLAAPWTAGKSHEGPVPLSDYERETR